MPCDTQRTITVNLAVADAAILMGALVTAKLSPRLLQGNAGIEVTHPEYGRAVIRNGVIEATEGWASNWSPARLTELAGTMKRAYAVEAVQVVTKRFGYSATVDAKDPNHLTLARRFG